MSGRIIKRENRQGKRKQKARLKRNSSRRKGRKKIPCNNSRPATLRKHSYSPATYTNKSCKGKVSATTEMRRRQRKDIKQNLLSLSVASRALPFPSFAFVASACTILRASSLPAQRQMLTKCKRKEARQGAAKGLQNGPKLEVPKFALASKRP